MNSQVWNSSDLANLIASNMSVADIASAGASSRAMQEALRPPLQNLRDLRQRMLGSWPGFVEVVGNVNARTAPVIAKALPEFYSNALAIPHNLILSTRAGLGLSKLFTVKQIERIRRLLSNHRDLSLYINLVYHLQLMSPEERAAGKALFESHPNVWSRDGPMTRADREAAKIMYLSKINGWDRADAMYRILHLLQQ